MNKGILFLFCNILFTIYTSIAQDTLKIYGSYVNINSPRNTNNSSLDVFVYVSTESTLPDSISVLGKGIAVKSDYEMLCNGLSKHRYHLDFYNSNPNGIEVTAKFNNVPTVFIGTNDTIKKEFLGFSGYNNERLLTKTITFKDYPIITVEKGKTAILNLTKEFKIWTMNFPKFSISKVGTFKESMGIVLNGNTGDIIIDGNKLDTGLYTFKLTASEYSDANTFYYFSVRITNKQLPYFQIPENQQRDIIGIPTFIATKKDSIFSYLVKYIKPGGLGQFTVHWESPEKHKNPPQLKTIKTNDSTLDIELRIPFDSIGFINSLTISTIYVFGSEKNLINSEKIPETYSIIINTIDSQGQCNMDMTSLYISRDMFKFTGINELKNYQKIKIYPNPNNGKFIIECDEAIEIQIFDLLGKEILTQNVSNKTNIDLSGQPKGIYFVKVIGKENYNFKLLIE